MIQTLFLAIYWYITFLVFAAIALPVSMRIFRRLPEKGILLSRPLGWLLISFFSWFIAFAGIPFNRFGIGLVCVLLCGLSCFLLKTNTAWFVRNFKAGWRTALNGEIITVLVFLLILFVRYRDPNIDHTEKPMDAMMLNSLVAASHMPPQDAWFTGAPINYHYGGYMLHSVPVKLTGIPPEYAYNLIIPMVAAIAASIAFCLGRALFGRCRLAVISVICTLFIGNLASIVEIFRKGDWLNPLGAWRWTYLWNTSRVIHDASGETINEYPLFSILWGDIHPHFSNIPFVLLFMVLCYALFQAISRHTIQRMIRHEWLLLASAVISAALLFPTNVFDFPVFSLFLGMVILSLLIKSYFTETNFRPNVITGLIILLIPIAGYLLASPFWLNFQSPLEKSPVRLVTERTGLFDFLLVFGAHLTATVIYLILTFYDSAIKRSKDEIVFVGFFFAIIMVLLWGITGSIATMISVVLMSLFWMMLLIPAGPVENKSLNTTFSLAACALAWSLIAGCEFIYLKDSYGIARMNTLFKFHFPAWILFGAGLPPLLYHAIREQEDIRIKWGSLVPVIIISALSLIGPIYAIGSMYMIPAAQRSATLNGIDFLQKNAPKQYEIIRWIKDNTQPSDVIIEPPGGAYSLENIFSAFTGRSTVIGWVNHEHLWRPNMTTQGNTITDVNKRQSDVFTFYTTPKWEDAKAILIKYKIKYVTFNPPTNADILRQMSNTKGAAFRSNLKVIIKGQGDGTTPELYEVIAEKLQ